MPKSAAKKRKLNTPLENPMHESFCQLYALEREFMGNGTSCYIEAFDIDVKRKGAYDGARASASRLLATVNILTRINELLSTEGFNDENVKKQHLFLINQDADLKTKKGAVELYYKVEGKIDDKNKLEGTITLKWDDDNQNPVPAKTVGKTAA